MVGIGKKRIFSKRLPLSSKTKRDVRWYSPEICPPHAIVWMTASRLNSYSLSARRNSVSFCAIVRMMRSTSAGAPERLTTGEELSAEALVCASAAAGHSAAAARIEKINLFINTLPEVRRIRRREALSVYESSTRKPPAEQNFRCARPRVCCHSGLRNADFGLRIKCSTLLVL